MKFWIYIGVFLFIHIICRGQQRPLYSNYLQNGIVYNPALTGSAGALSVSLSSRIQWAGVENAPQTHTVAAHSPLPGNLLSAGFLVSYDRFGASTNTDIFNTYALRYKLKGFNIALGGLIGFTMVNNSDANETLNNPEDPAFTKNLQQLIPKAGIGLHVEYKNFFGGLSLPSIPLVKTTGMVDYSFFFNQQFIYGGYNIKMSDNFVLRPSIYVKRLNNTGEQIDLNMIGTFYKKFMGGISYRHQSAIVALLNMRVNKQLYVGYSYDYLLSNLNTVSNGNHEIFIRYDFMYLINDVNVKKFR